MMTKLVTPPSIYVYLIPSKRVDDDNGDDDDGDDDDEYDYDDFDVGERKGANQRARENIDTIRTQQQAESRTRK